MISESAMRSIEEKALDRFAENGRMSKMSDDSIVGQIPEWTDADRYRMVDAECIIPGDVIKDWLYDDFSTVVEKYLKTIGQKEIGDNAPEDVKLSPITYFEYCMDIYQEVEDYFWDQIYPELQQNYFEDHAEKV